MADLIEYKSLTLDPPLNVTLIKDFSNLGLLKEYFNRCQGVTGLDTETNPVNNFWFRKCRTIQFGNRNEQYVIDLLPFAGSSEVLEECQGEFGEHLDKAPNIKLLLKELEPVLCTHEIIKAGVVLSFEYMVMYWSFGIRSYGLYCCEIVERVIRAGELSLKNYGNFSMESLMKRYFKIQIDKELQTSFNTSSELTQDQINYAALDTRLPFPIKQAQERLLKSDKLEKVAKLENNAIGAFVDMHLHGDNLYCEKWKVRTEKKKEELKEVIHNLDKEFLPIVGNKNVKITDEEVEKAKQLWKSLTIVSNSEIELKAQIRKEKNLELKAELEKQKQSIESFRKAEKDKLKEVHSELSKKRTKLNKRIEDCEGDALINYASGPQLLEALGQVPGLKSIKDTENETLEGLSKFPIIQHLMSYRTLSKAISTYGDQWVTKWVTGPSGAEGWIHPMDGKLHPVYQQIGAETGRSSSSKPNGQNVDSDEEVRSCFIADPPNDVEEYVLITIDMSGAELRILAELANDATWQGAFQRKEDLHSVSTEILYPNKWPVIGDKDCAYYALREDGKFDKQKCKCKEHKVLRNKTKSVNFLLINGGGPGKLSKDIKSSMTEARQIMDNHRKEFPNIWGYLEESGRKAQVLKESRDLFGRRRKFIQPTWEKATELAIDDFEEQCRFPETQCNENVKSFIERVGRSPNKEEKFKLTHRNPNAKEIARCLKGLFGSIERQGKNHEMQGTNASIIKVAMGSGFCKEGKPFLSHILPKYRAKLIKLIHDELVVQSPKQYAQEVAEHIQDCFKRAGQMVMKKVMMESEFSIGKVWSK